MFGHIPGIKPGQIFEDRKALRHSGIHAPLMAGIWGAQEGAYSIVLSGGYEDDIDELDYILYTGQGGQDVPGGKQVSHQEYTKGNRGLQLSCDYNLPIRVTRGHQIKNGLHQATVMMGYIMFKNMNVWSGKGVFIFVAFISLVRQVLKIWSLVQRIALKAHTNGLHVQRL